MTVITCCRKCN